MSPNLELILAYFEDLEKKKFFGNVEITMQNGELGYVRELRSKQAHEIAASAVATLPKERTDKILQSFKGHEKFLNSLKKLSKTQQKE